MKIYFSGAITAVTKKEAQKYKQLINYLHKYGKVLTEHCWERHGETDGEIYHRDMAWLEESDVVVAEITIRSHGVGIELRSAEIWGKKTLCLFHPSKKRVLSAMVSGDDYFLIKNYHTKEEAHKYIDDFFQNLNKGGNK